MDGANAKSVSDSLGIMTVYKSLETTTDDLQERMHKIWIDGLRSGEITESIQLSIVEHFGPPLDSGIVLEFGERARKLHEILWEM